MPRSSSLQREAKMIVEVRGVEDDQERVGPPLAVLLAEEDVAGDRFVGAGGIEAIGAGKVDQFDRTAIAEHQPARLPLDRDAGIIADLLPRAGQRVEQRALAGIGAADDRDQREAGSPRLRSGRGRRARGAGGWRPSSGRRGSRSDRGRTGPGAAARPATPSSKPKLRSRLASVAPSSSQPMATTRAGGRRARRSSVIRSDWNGAFIVASDYH